MTWRRPRIERALLVAAAVGLLGTACSGSDDADDAAVAPTTIASAGTGTPGATTAGGEECTSAHAHHLTMMWNPTMADEMTDLGCPFPYEPYIAEPTDASASPDVTVPFEVRKYSDLWTLLGTAGAGTCAVAPIPEPAGADGFTFGFTYGLGEAGCPSGPIAQLEVREYVAVGDRDAAALGHGDDEEITVVVLGRWSIALTALEPSGDAIVAQVADALVGIGAQAVGA